MRCTSQGPIPFTISSIEDNPRAPIDSTQLKNMSAISDSLRLCRELFNKSCLNWRFPILFPCSMSFVFRKKHVLFILCGKLEEIQRKTATNKKVLLWSKRSRTYVVPEAMFKLLHKQYITYGTTWIYCLCLLSLERMTAPYWFYFLPCEQWYSLSKAQ